MKPENVLIADDGRIKVADFGLAKAISATTQHTATGVLIGTVSYVAPELVVEGRSDARADVYAVGVILYELLTGKKPHEGETPIQVAYKHVHEDVPPPSRRVPGIPDYVDALVARATARDREQRPADAGVLLHHLRRVNQAVTAGVRSDPELVDDLLPRKIADTAEVLRRQGPPRRRHQPASRGTTPRWPRCWRRRARPTTTIERPSASRRPSPSGPRPVPPPPPPSKPTKRPRRRRRGPILLVLALLVAAAVGTGAWYFGYARYTTTPAVLRLSPRATREQRLEAAGLDVNDGEPDVLRHGRRRGGCCSTDPSAGKRVLKGTDVTITVSLGRAVQQLPKLTGITEDQAQDRILNANMAFGKSTKAFSETVPEGIVIASDPKGGTTLRFGTIVDLVVSKGRRPIPVGSWAGKSADDAAAGARAARAQGQRLPAVLRQRLRGHRHLPGPEDRHPLQGRHRSSCWSPSAPSWSRSRTSSRTASTTPPRPSRAPASPSTSQEAPGYIGLGYVFSMDPGAGTELPIGSTVTIYLV